MRQPIGLGAIAALALAGLAAGTVRAETTLRVGFCARTITSAAAPFAIANKMGWFKPGGFAVELVALPGSTDCVKYVGTREVLYAIPSVEPLASLRPQGVLAKIFYTAYQGNIYGPAVPADSPIQTLADLKGKRIGVQSMASGGYPVARGIAASLGLDPDTDVSIIVVGEGAQAAGLLRARQVDALSLYDTQYALIENLGVPLRRIAAKEFDRFPSNGLIALDETLAKRRAEAVILAQGYAEGTIFALENPEAAVRIVWEVFPQTKATGKDEADALKDDIKTLEARAANWKLEKAGVKRWGESSADNYQAYLDFLLKRGVIKEPVKAADVITNDLIADINAFDAQRIAAGAKSYKAER
jgi:NitT/TauT family transport system substrate-binding protein